MTYDELRQIILDEIQNSQTPGTFDKSSVKDDDDLIALGLVDSFAFLEIVAATEEKANIEIDLSEVEPAIFSTLGGLIKSALKAP